MRCRATAGASIARAASSARCRRRTRSPRAASMPAELATIEGMRAKAFVGTAGEVGEALRALARRLELDELVVNTWAHQPAVRRRSYALLAREFGLAGAGSDAAR